MGRPAEIVSIQVLGSLGRRPYVAELKEFWHKHGFWVINYQMSYFYYKLKGLPERLEQK